MMPIRVIAISTDIAESGAKDEERSALRLPSIHGGRYRRCAVQALPGHDFCGGTVDAFTHDAFEGVEKLPLPGPVYVHAEACERYPEDGGFPAELRNSPRTLNA